MNFLLMGLRLRRRQSDPERYADLSGRGARSRPRIAVLREEGANRRRCERDGLRVTKSGFPVLERPVVADLAA